MDVTGWPAAGMVQVRVSLWTWGFKSPLAHATQGNPPRSKRPSREPPGRAPEQLSTDRVPLPHEGGGTSSCTDSACSSGDGSGESDDDVEDDPGPSLTALRRSELTGRKVRSVVAPEFPGFPGLAPSTAGANFGGLRAVPDAGPATSSAQIGSRHRRSARHLPVAALR
jgi:hypothetical protein